MNKSIVVFALFFASTAALAQDAYKCKVNGSMVIQESPCKVSGPPPTEPDLPASNETIQQASSLCEAQVRASMKDPESARITNIHRGGIGKWCKPARDVRYYWMMVNGKNSYGGYVGEKPYRCALNMSETVVLGISQIGEFEQVIPCR